MTIRLPFQPITAKFYEQMPLGPPYYQLIEGNLIMSPSASFRHQRILGRLYAALEIYLQHHPIGLAVIAPSDVQINQINIFQPDLYYVKNENRHRITAQGVEGAPDLVVEILSPSNREQDLTVKRDVYLRAGVPEMWTVDPEAETLEVHALASGPAAVPQVFSQGDVFLPALFPGLAISLKQLFLTI